MARDPVTGAATLPQQQVGPRRPSVAGAGCRGEAVLGALPVEPPAGRHVGLP